MTYRLHAWHCICSLCEEAKKIINKEMLEGIRQSKKNPPCEDKERQKALTEEKEKGFDEGWNLACQEILKEVRQVKRKEWNSMELQDFIIGTIIMIMRAKP